MYLAPHSGGDGAERIVDLCARDGRDRGVPSATDCGAHRSGHNQEEVRGPYF